MLSKADTNQPVLLVSKKKQPVLHCGSVIQIFFIVDENGYREWKIQACRCK